MEEIAKNPIPVVLGILSLSTVGLNFMATRGKASKVTVDTLIAKIAAQADTIIELKKNDLQLQRDLNHKELTIQKLELENKEDRTELARYKKIVENRSPELEETLTLVVSGVNQLHDRIDRLEGVSDK